MVLERPHNWCIGWRTSTAMTIPVVVLLFVTCTRITRGGSSHVDCSSGLCWKVRGGQGMLDRRKLDGTSNSSSNSNVTSCSRACPGKTESLGLSSTPPTCECVYPIELILELSNATALENNVEGFLTALSNQLNLTRNSTTKQVDFHGWNLNGQLVNVTLWILPLSGKEVTSAQRDKISTALTSGQVDLPQTLGTYRVISLNQLAPPPPSPPPPPPPPSPPPAPPPPLSPPAPPTKRKSGGGINIAVIGGIAGGIVVLLAALLCTLWLCCCRNREADKGSEDYDKIGTSSAGMSRKLSQNGELKAPVSASEPASVPRHMSTKVFTYEELVEATAGFDPSTVLGEGGFGRVYRGLLKDGTAVAIKKLTRGGHQGDREFLVEVEMLSRLHHRHLVKLIGYYASRDSKQQLLCYELIPNGTLEYWLHGNLGDKSGLDWNLRMKVAIGAARGLAYLHEDSQPTVIHRDFKASNILLTHSFNAKVADFGLAKQAPEVQGGYVSTRVMGTFGYVAPEYAMTGHLLVKSDVYSFGVVLLELLSGRKPVDMTQPAGEENLVTWARPLLHDRELHPELVDPRLNGDYPADDFAHVAAIASACVSQDIVHRPTMGEVVQSLKLVQREPEHQNDDSLDGPLVTADGALTGEVPSAQFSTGWPVMRQGSTNQGAEPSENSFVSQGSGAPLFANQASSTTKSRETRTDVFLSEDLEEGR